MCYEIKSRGYHAFLKVITVFVKFKWNYFDGLLTVPSPASKLFASRAIFARALPGGVLPYITYTGMCAQRGRDFEAPDLERGINFRGVF